MKKLLASLLVLAMCAPAMALTFSTSATDNVLTINYNLAAGEGLRGLALTITQVGAGDAAVTDVDAGAFNTFMDYAYTAGDQYTIDPDNQHPVALIDGPGAATLPAAALGGFSLSMGYLDENGVEPKGEAITTSGSIVVTFEGSVDTEVAVALDTLRGGAVGDALEVDDSGLANRTLVFAEPPCFNHSDAAKNTLWETYGRPDCWCWSYNCRADMDGKLTLNKPATVADLNVLKEVYNIKYVDMDVATQAKAACADLDRKQTLGKPVTVGDLNILKTYYNEKTAAAGGTVPACGSADGVVIVKPAVNY